MPHATDPQIDPLRGGRALRPGPLYRNFHVDLALPTVDGSVGMIILHSSTASGKGSIQFPAVSSPHGPALNHLASGLAHALPGSRRRPKHTAMAQGVVPRTRRRCPSSARSPPPRPGAPRGKVVGNCWGPTRPTMAVPLSSNRANWPACLSPHPKSDPPPDTATHPFCRCGGLSNASEPQKNELPPDR